MNRIIRLVVLFACCVGGILNAEEKANLVDLGQLTKAGQRWVEAGRSYHAMDPELAAQQGRTITVEGFLHEDERGYWSIAPQPSLRSCCLGGREKAALQVFVDRTFAAEDIQKRQGVRGRFVVDPLFDDEGSLVQLYRLENVEAIDVGGHSFPYLSLGLFCAVGAVAATLVMRERRKRD